MENLHVISDDNAAQIIQDGISAGRATGYIAGQPNLKASFSDTYTTIPRDQWKSLIEQGQGTFLSDLIKAYKIPSKDQDGLGYCWVYASTSCLETCRAIQNQPYVNLSPESAGGPVRNWRNQGGFGTEALKQLTNVGACAMSFMDKPNSLAPSRWKAGWEADCANHKIINSWAAVNTFDEVMTALFLRLPVSIGLAWWSHQVLLTDPAIVSGGYGVVMRNSWGEDWPTAGAGGWSTLTEAKAQPDGTFAAINVTPTDAWVRGARIDSLSAVAAHQRHLQKAIEQCLQS